MGDSDPIEPSPSDGLAAETARPPADDPGRFGWHPEPGLLGIDDTDLSRPAMERLGRETWATALEYLYDEALGRAMGEPAGWADLRRAFFGPGNQPAPAPRAPTPSSELLADFRRRLAPHQLNAWHPRTLSYFTPTPLALSIAGEVLAQVSHQGIDVWDAGPAAAFVEEEVVSWLCRLVGYPAGSFGILASGGVMANFIGLAVARDAGLGRLLGLGRAPRGADLEGVRVYASDQAHFSIGRALDELGFPRDTLEVVPSDDQFRLQSEPVAERIARDRAAGIRPFAIAAVAGSTNTGSVDAIDGLADLAAREGLWLHVDAAYGGAARFSPRLAPRVPALERADSLTVDPHKWFFQAYDVGGVLVRDGALLEATFGGRRPEYYRVGERPSRAAGFDPSSGPVSFYKLGFEGTRRWRALKLWLSWRHLGSDGFARLVERNVEVAAYLARRCAEADDFEALPPDPELSVVCFRHLPGGRKRAYRLDAAELDAHQDRLQAALEASGDGWLSTTRLRGRTWLRAGILNYLTTESDIDRLLDRLGALATQ
jgi:aromatic-L-amino-acid decarboxylase